MIDSVLKGTGNSRFLKSAVPAGTSWADALAMLQAGTFPIDFNGINTEGFQQVGTPLNKANLLKDATAAHIGLPPSTTPDGMFQALGNTGELHVWRKTVVSSSEQPAGYTLGDVITNSEIWVENRYEEAVFHYATSISVSDAGLVSLVGEKTATIGHSNNGENIAEFDVFKGKFVYISGGDNNKRQFIFYIPANATFHRDGNYSTNKIYADKEQRVNAHGIIPAGTTTTYPVSTNPNAYQEGDDAKEAGYMLGDVVTGSFLMGASVPVATNDFYYTDAPTVSDNGVVSVPTENTPKISVGYKTNFDASTLNVLRGKFVFCSGDGRSDPIFYSVIYVPSDAVFTKADWDGELGYRYYLDKYQPVTGYAAIPASTTIEYLGKLGDKARVQVVSYVGTGTYGSSNPNSLTFDFVPKLVFISATNTERTMGIFSRSGFGIMLQAGPSSSSNTSMYSYLYEIKWKNKTLSWYATKTAYTEPSMCQLNKSGAKYTAVAIG